MSWYDEGHKETIIEISNAFWKIKLSTVLQAKGGGLCFSKGQFSFSAAHVVAPPFSSSILSNPFRAKKKRSVYIAFEEKLSKRIPLEV